MSRLVSKLGLGLMALVLSVAVQAETETTVVEKKVIITPSPQATCTTIDGHWEGNAWVSKHDVCKYENRTEGVAWVQDYWSCTVYKADGTCTSWELVPGHWVKTLQ